MTVAPEKKSSIETVQLPPERARCVYQALGTEDLERATSAMQTAFDELLNEDAELAEIFSKIVEAKARVAVFGGWARDRLFEVLHAQTAPSRDIDFVVDSPQPIAGFFPVGAKTNPFGGVGIKGASVPLEAWRLKETFLFKLRGEDGTFEALPATADYDINAILFFPAQCNGHASVLDAGAGHALKQRQIDFMADVVAQPKIQAARAVILATRLDLQPSEAVCDFVQDVCEKRETAREVELALDRYCPDSLKENARGLLERIRQGGSGGRPKSEFFVHCWGVFEGGGVRAAAHAGGFAAAKRAGITFGKVAGTSGGSIVAALVAAGATPGYLRQHLQELDFLPLLDQPNKEEIFFTSRLPLWARTLRLMTWGRFRTLANIAKYGGLYNSASLGNWIESRLVELVRPKGSSSKVPVLFSELPTPLHIVATDFSTGKPKIWSPETTGDESVTLAVRHSCTIPMFFQPAPSGSSIFFDGGAVSNLPAYVLNKQRGSSDERDVLPRILAFRLIADAKGARSVPDISDFIKRLADTVIDSASEIQLQLQPNVYPINIETGAIQSTDFGKVDASAKRFLYGRGMKCVRNFIEGERLNALHGDITTHEFQGFDEKMLLLVRQMPSCQHTLLAVGPDTYWLDYVFPSLLLLLRRGVAVTAVVPRGDGTALHPDEQRRRQLLELLGVSVINTVDGLPFVGFALDLGTARACTILTYHSADESQKATRYTHEKVRFYTADSDPVVLGMMNEQVGSYTVTAKSSSLALQYAASDPQKLLRRLQTIPAYKSASVGLRRISVNQQIVVMQKRIKEFKALQTRLLMSDLAKHGKRPFGHLEVQLAGVASTIVTPPVLELHAGSLVVIDGSARLHHCFSNGIEEVDAVVIENVAEPLPSDGRFPLGSLRLVSSTVPIPKNYQNFRESAFRPIERAVHQSYD
jgi:predicted acylesterase/phospholipase RssA